MAVVEADIKKEIITERSAKREKSSDDLKSLSEKIIEFSKSLIESVSTDIDNFTHYNLKYFEDYYNITHNVYNKNNDILIRKHSNNAILISIAKGHDIIRNKKKVVEIDFGNKNNVVNLHYGKSKRGAHLVGHNAILCRIKCEGEDITYPIYTGVKGRLIEINENVFKNPSLITTSYKNLSYIAILLPHNGTDVTTHLLNEEQYEDYLQHR